MDKDEINKVFDKAVQHQEAGRKDEAKESYDKILDMEAELLARNKGGMPNLAINQMLSNVHNNYGILHFGDKDMREAARYFRNSLDLIPNNIDAHTNLGLAQHHLGNIDGAIACFRQALEIRDDFMPARLHLGKCLRRNGQIIEAEKILLSILATDPNPEVMMEHGLILAETNRLAEAIKVFEEAAILNPNLAGLQMNLANGYFQIGEAQKAVECLQKGVEQDPENAVAWANLGTYLQRMGRIDESFNAYQQAFTKDPFYAPGAVNFANLLNQAGKLDMAWEVVQKTLSKNPAYPPLQIIIAKLEHLRGKPEEGIARLEALNQRGVVDQDGAQVNQLLGRLYDEKGDFDKVFQSYDRFNELELTVPGRSNFNADLPLEGMELLKAVDLSKFKPSKKSEGKDPIFVVGLPLSGNAIVADIFHRFEGTNLMLEAPLIEMLAQSLPKIGVDYPKGVPTLSDEVIGKLRKEYWNNAKNMGYDGQSQFVDSFGYNYFDIPLIVKMFPDAKIIVCYRHPLENALVCYMNEFQFNEITANFTSKEKAAKFISSSFDLIKHYENSLDLNIYKLRFESLVTDTEKTLEDLETFTGLSGLTFTSMGESKAGIGRWPRYGDHLTEISKTLGSTIKDLGFSN